MMNVAGLVLLIGLLAAFPLHGQSAAASSPNFHLPGFDIAGCASRADCDEKCVHGDAKICLTLAEAFTFQHQGDLAYGYFTRACVAGTAADCREFGARYESGNAVLADRERAGELYQISCRRGDASGCTRLERIQPVPLSELVRPQNFPAFKPVTTLGDCQPADSVVLPVPVPHPGISVYKDYEVDRPPQLILESRIDPCYPEQALQQGISGRVVIEAEIDEQGAVLDARVIRSDNAIFNGASLATVRRWRYLPAMMHGQAVIVFKIVTLHFGLH